MKKNEEVKEKWSRRKEEKTFKYLKHLPEIIKSDMIEDTTNYILNHPNADGTKTDLMTITLDTDIKVIVEARDLRGCIEFGISFMSDLPIKTLLSIYQRDVTFRGQVLSGETIYDVNLMINTMSKYIVSRKKVGQLMKYFPGLTKTIEDSLWCSDETKFTDIKHVIDLVAGVVYFQMKFNDPLEGEVTINCSVDICDFPELIEK